MAEVAFFAPMRRPPTATGSNGKRYDGRSGAVYDSPALARARESIEAAIAPHSPSRPLTGPLSVEVRWCYPLRGRHRQGDPYAQKPDIDNSVKALLDALVRLGFISDDRLIAELRVVQAWAEPPGVYVRCAEIGGAPGAGRM